MLGNIAEEDTLSLTRQIQNMIKDAPSVSWVPGNMWIRAVPEHISLVCEVSANPNCSNCATLVYWQLPAALEAAGRLLDVSARTFFFNNLRTQRQLGYIVWSFFSGLAGSSGFNVIVQSNSVGTTRM